MKQHGPWRIVGTREVYQDPWIALRVDDVVRPDGKPGTFGVVHIKSGVAVLPVDDDGNVYLSEEFRYALGRVSLEVCAGALEPGEAPAEAARRELREELGIEAASWLDLGRLDPLTSMVDSPSYMFVARGLGFTTSHQEGTETIRPVKMALADAVRAALDGRITSATSCTLILKAYLRATMS